MNNLFQVFGLTITFCLQDVRTTHHQREEARLEVDRLNEQIRQSSVSAEENSRQEKTKYQELQDLMRSLVEREKEHQEARLVSAVNIIIMDTILNIQCRANVVSPLLKQ